MKSSSFCIPKTIAFLKKIDIFGLKTQIKMNNKTRFSTAIGGCFSLMGFLISCLLFIYVDINMINHENPISLTSEIYVNDPLKTFFSKEKNFLMFGVQYPNFTHYIDESVYKMTVTSRKIVKNNQNDSFKKQVTLERCQPNLLPRVHQ